MYRLLYFLVLCGLSRSAPQTSGSRVVEPIRTKCLAEAELATDYRIRNVTESIIGEPKAKCLIGCLWRENRWLNDDGSLNPTKWIEKIPQASQKYKDAINECSKENDEDLCEMVFKFFMCCNAKRLADVYGDPI